MTLEEQIARAIDPQAWDDDNEWRYFPALHGASSRERREWSQEAALAVARRVIDTLQHTTALVAQAEATLALVEQQRVANLIAVMQMEGGPYKDINGWGGARVEAVSEIRKALGLDGGDQS